MPDLVPETPTPARSWPAWPAAIAPYLATLNVSDMVRDILAVILIGGMFWMEWQSPKQGKVPESLIAAAGLATGFFLTGDSSRIMKAIVALTYVTAYVAFLMAFDWVPESINSQVTTVLGAYYGLKRTATATPPVTP